MLLPLPAPQLKKILVDENLITAERFDELLADAERKNQNLLEILVAEKIVDINYLNNAIANALGVPRVDFSARPLDKEVVKALPEEMARTRPVSYTHLTLP